MPFVTLMIGSRVWRPRSSSIRLSKSGDRCWSTTKAMPLSGGTAAKNFSSGSSPPAEAPMPTTRNFEGVSSIWVVWAWFMALF